MKTSVISPEFRERYLSKPGDLDAFEGPVVVFDGPEDYHHRIDDPATGITAETLLIMRGAGPVGYPGAAEVVNMRPPAHLIMDGVHALPCIGDGRQSGTSGSPSILNASPEAAARSWRARKRISGSRRRWGCRGTTTEGLRHVRDGHRPTRSCVLTPVPTTARCRSPRPALPTDARP
jgi:dihydroxy-acid dehydratase